MYSGPEISLSVSRHVTLSACARVMVLIHIFVYVSVTLTPQSVIIRMLKLQPRRCLDDTLQYLNYYFLDRKKARVVGYIHRSTQQSYMFVNLT